MPINLNEKSIPYKVRQETDFILNLCQNLAFYRSSHY